MICAFQLEKQPISGTLQRLMEESRQPDIIMIIRQHCTSQPRKKNDYETEKMQ